MKTVKHAASFATQERPILRVALYAFSENFTELSAPGCTPYFFSSTANSLGASSSSVSTSSKGLRLRTSRGAVRPSSAIWPRTANPRPSRAR